MAFKENLKQARLAAKLSQPELAALCGWESQSRVSNYETGTRTPALDDIYSLAKALNIESSQLIRQDHYLIKQENANYEVVATGKQINQVPLISWVQAGNFSECFEDLQDCEMISTDAKVTHCTFALRIKGDSMQPLFQPGMILIVEPELVPISGDYVIAKNGNNEATFKQLIQDGSDWYLKPLNDRYPLKSAHNIDIIGVVIQSVTKFK